MFIQLISFHSFAIFHFNGFHRENGTDHSCIPNKRSVMQIMFQDILKLDHCLTITGLEWTRHKSKNALKLMLDFVLMIWNFFASKIGMSTLGSFPGILQNCVDDSTWGLKNPSTTLTNRNRVFTFAALADKMELNATIPSRLVRNRSAFA